MKAVHSFCAVAFGTALVIGMIDAAPKRDSNEQLIHAVSIAVHEPEDPKIEQLHWRVICRLYRALNEADKKEFNRILQEAGYVLPELTAPATDPEMYQYKEAPKAITYNACLMARAFPNIGSTYFK